MAKLLALLLLLRLLTGCAAIPVSAAGDDLRWCPEERPVYVWISDAMSSECIAFTLNAIDWWAAQGVRYLHPLIVPDRQITRNHPLPRIVQVNGDEPPDPYATADTRIVRLEPWCLKAAEIRIRTCRAQTVAHELGHALGLDHTNDSTNLMFPWVLTDRDGPWGLTDDQRLRLR